MDDFGTGYSSLAQLHTMPVDVLKIDKVFVGGTATGKQEWAFAAAIIALAHSLGKRTLAEGIEHPSQLTHLRSLGCELGQGFLFGGPMPLRECISFLAGTSAPRHDLLAAAVTETPP
jgi:EAL domain-containing protein (putative c-di-GMP-specific phosphodiesterase class I)